jgi:putative heme-binding domain-containing protein
MVLAATSTRPRATPAFPLPEDLAEGKRLYDGHCARCHGIGGTGGEGPSLTRPTLPRAPDDQALTTVIREGIPGTEMPRTRRMTDGEMARLVGYVRSLGRVPPTPVAGDPERGRAIYQEKGTCFVCHIVQGEGGSLGPVLTDVGARRAPPYLRASLLDPGASVSPKYLVVRVVTGDGREVRGIRVNEDAFTIQLRDETLRLHSLQKFELKELHKEFDKSLMPSFANELSVSEIDDLVAFLAGLRGEP